MGNLNRIALEDSKSTSDSLNQRGDTLIDNASCHFRSLAGDTLILNDTKSAETDSNFMEKFFINGNKFVPVRNDVHFLEVMRRPWHLQILTR